MAFMWLRCRVSSPEGTESFFHALGPRKHHVTAEPFVPAVHSAGSRRHAVTALKTPVGGALTFLVIDVPEPTQYTKAVRVGSTGPYSLRASSPACILNQVLRIFIYKGCVSTPFLTLPYLPTPLLYIVSAWQTRNLRLRKMKVWHNASLHAAHVGLVCSSPVRVT